MATTQLGNIEPFETGSDDWEHYSERLDQFMLPNGINDEKSLCHCHQTETCTKPRGTDEAAQNEI